MKKAFLRSLAISSIVLLCLNGAAFGIARAYENTRRIGFGEYRKAVELDGDKIKILDFEFKIF